MEITTVGLDLAKHVFQVHAVDADGHVVMRKTLRRAQMVPFFQKLPRCLIGIEACGTSHYWARVRLHLGDGGHSLLRLGMLLRNLLIDIRDLARLLQRLRLHLRIGRIDLLACGIGRHIQQHRRCPAHQHGPQPLQPGAIQLKAQQVL